MVLQSTQHPSWPLKTQYTAPSWLLSSNKFLMRCYHGNSHRIIYHILSSQVQLCPPLTHRPIITAIDAVTPTITQGHTFPSTTISVLYMLYMMQTLAQNQNNFPPTQKFTNPMNINNNMNDPSNDDDIACSRRQDTQSVLPQAIPPK